MPKDWRDEHLPSVSEQLRQEAPEPHHKKAGKRRKEYPPHWQVRVNHFGNRDDNSASVMITPHRYTGSVRNMPWYGLYPQKRMTLQEKLDFLAEKYPETANWPVRWLSGQSIPCNLEILAN